MENEILSTLKQPGVNYGGAPTWASLTNPQFSQLKIDHFINRGYVRMMSDIAELQVFVITSTITSVANTFSYVIPPVQAPVLPAIALLNRVQYQPVGLNYVKEFIPGLELLAWDKYQAYTGYGYYQKLSFGVQPRICSMSIDRTSLFFYPGSAQSGDTITISYAPLPTPSAATVPYLVNETDAPVTPDDTHDAIVQAALWMLWKNSREAEASREAFAMYQSELKRIKDNWLKRTQGDVFSITLDDRYGAISDMGWYP